MTKALGFLAGVCLTVATFALVLDRWQQPEETSPAPQIAEQPDVVATAENTAPIDAANADKLSDTADTDSEADTGAVEDKPEAAAETAATDTGDKVDAAPAAGGSQPGEPFAAAQPETAETAATFAPQSEPQPDIAGEDTPQTHLFWSPFRSEWAARGFARRLTNSTQIPIEVVGAGAGNYRVAFDYRDESERRAHIERIEAITGLQLE